MDNPPPVFPYIFRLVVSSSLTIVIKVTAAVMIEPRSVRGCLGLDERKCGYWEKGSAFKRRKMIEETYHCKEIREIESELRPC